MLTNRITITKSNTLNKKPDNNFYLTKRAFIIQETSTDQSNWYLDFCTSRHIYHKKNSFFKLCLKSYKFMTANKDIIRLEKVSMI